MATGKTSISREEVRRYLEYRCKHHDLVVQEYFPLLNNDRGFFLIAATGLGKTVAVPIHALLKHDQQREPAGVGISSRILVVQPKIMIAQSLQEEMQDSWAEWWELQHGAQAGTAPLLFGVKTSADKEAEHDKAPILFITTGIFGIYALSQRISKRDAVIIDEAHVTISADDAVELGIVLCRRRGIKTSFMSATVERRSVESSLDVPVVDASNRVRQPIWTISLGIPLEKAILGLVQGTIGASQVAAEFLPSVAMQQQEPEAKRVAAAVMEQDRCKGLLIIVNSHAGARSDTNQILAILREGSFERDFELLSVNGPELRNRQKKIRFYARLKEFRDAKRRYVVVATSVVEMGVTFPDLDFVVTMDRVIEQVRYGDMMLTERVGLRANALRQRIGRVGRSRPGVAFIACEDLEEAPKFSKAECETLNAALAPSVYRGLARQHPNAAKDTGLAAEPIELPMLQGPLTLLAHYSYEHEWPDGELESRVKSMQLPSFISLRSNERLFTARMGQLRRKRSEMLGLGLAKPDELTERGRAVQGWIGRVPISCAAEIQDAITKHDLPLLGFWLLYSSLYVRGFYSLLGPGNCVILDAMEHHSRPYVPVTVHGRKLMLPAFCEALFAHGILSPLLVELSRLADLPTHVERAARDRFDRACRIVGLDPAKVQGTHDTLRDLWKVCVDINRRLGAEGSRWEVLSLGKGRDMTDERLRLVFSSPISYERHRSVFEAIRNLPDRTQPQTFERKLVRYRRKPGPEAEAEVSESMDELSMEVIGQRLPKELSVRLEGRPIWFPYSSNELQGRLSINRESFSVELVDIVVTNINWSTIEFPSPEPPQRQPVNQKPWLNPRPPNAPADVSASTPSRPARQNAEPSPSNPHGPSAGEGVIAARKEPVRLTIPAHPSTSHVTDVPEGPSVGPSTPAPTGSPEPSDRPGRTAGQRTAIVVAMALIAMALLCVLAQKRQSPHGDRAIHRQRRQPLLGSHPIHDHGPLGGITLLKDPQTEQISLVYHIVRNGHTSVRLARWIGADGWSASTIYENFAVWSGGAVSDSDGTVHLALNDEGRPAQSLVYYATNQGGSWRRPVPISERRGALPNIDLDRRGAVHVIASGATSPLLYITNAQGSWHTSETTADMSLQTSRVRASGLEIPVVTYSDCTEPDQRDIFSMSPPTWAASRTHVSTSGATRCSFQSLQSFAGTAYLLYSAPHDYPEYEFLRFQYRPVGGAWTPPLDVTSATSPIHSLDLVFDSSGNRYFIFCDGDGAVRAISSANGVIRRTSIGESCAYELDGIFAANSLIVAYRTNVGAGGIVVVGVSASSL